MHPVSNVDLKIHTIVSMFSTNIFPQKFSTACDVISQKVNNPVHFQ